MKKIRSVFMYVFVLCMMVSIVGCSTSKEVKVIKGDNTAIIKGKYLITEKNEKYGVMDLKKKQIIKNSYDSMNYSKETQLFAVSKDNKSGVINEKEEVIIPIKYSFLDLGMNKEIYASDFTQTKVFNTKGKILKTFNYAMLTSLGNNTLLGVKEITYDEDAQQYNFKGYELLDSEGNVIKTFDYDEMTMLYDTHENYKDGKVMSFYVKKGNECGVLNLQGEVLIPMVTSLEKSINESGIEQVSFMENMYYNSYTKSYLVNKDGKYGVYDNAGKVLIDFNYDQIDANSNGYFATINTASEEDYSNLFYYFDLQGNEMFHVKAHMAQPFSNKGYVAIMNEQETYFLDKKGERKDLEILTKDELYADKFDSLGRVGIRYSEKGKKYFGLIDEQGKFVIKPIKMPDNLMSFIRFIGDDYEGFDSSRAYEKTSKVNSTNYAVFTYKDVKTEDGMSSSTFDKTIIYDKKGKKLGSVNAMIREPLSNGMLVAFKEAENDGEDSKLGLVGKNGEILTDIIYETIEEYDDYLYAVKGSQRYLLSKENGEIVLEY